MKMKTGGGGDLGCEEQAHKQISSNPMPPPFSPLHNQPITTTLPQPDQDKDTTRSRLGTERAEMRSATLEGISWICVL